MTKLDEMWVEVAKYQSIADDKGHGKTWAEMCRLRTVEACRAASNAAAANADNAAYAAAAYAAKYAYAASAANYAADAAKYAADAAYAQYCMQQAIKRINHAIKLAEKQK